MTSTPIPTPRRRYRTFMAWLRDFRYAPIRPAADPIPSSQEEPVQIPRMHALLVTSHEGKKVILVKPSTVTWGDIKNELEECYFPGANYSLRLNGTHLDETREIADYGLKWDTQIQLVPSLRGGANPERSHDKSFGKDGAWKESLGYTKSAKELDVDDLMATVKAQLERYIIRKRDRSVLKDVLKRVGEDEEKKWFGKAKNKVTTMKSKDASSEKIEAYLNQQVKNRLQDLLDMEDPPDIDIFADDDKQSSDEYSSDNCSTDEDSDSEDWQSDENSDLEDDEQEDCEIGTIDVEHKRAAHNDAAQLVDFRHENDASCQKAADQSVLRQLRDKCRGFVNESDTRVTIDDLKKHLSEVLATIYASFHGLEARDMRTVMNHMAVHGDKDDENYATEMGRMRKIALVLDNFAEDGHTKNDEDRFHEDAVDIVNDSCNKTKTAYHSKTLEKRVRWEYHATVVSLCLIFRVEPSFTVMVDKDTKDETGGYSAKFTNADHYQHQAHQLLLSHLDATEQQDPEDAVEEYREECERNKQLVMPIACLNKAQICKLAATKAQIALPIVRMIEEGQEPEKVKEALEREDSDSEDDGIPLGELDRVDKADTSDYEDEATPQQMENKQKLKELVDEQSGDPANKQISAYYVAKHDLMEMYYEQHEKVWKYLYAKAHIEEHFLECTEEQFKVLVHAFAGNPSGVYRWGPCKGDRNEFHGYRTDHLTDLFHCDNCNGLCSLPGHEVDGFPTSQLMRTRGTENEWALYCCKAQPVVNDSLKRKRSCVRRRLQQGTTAERDTNCPQASGSCVAFFEASKKAVLGDQKEAADSTCYKKDIQDAERDEEHHYIKQHMKTTVGKVYEEDKQALQEAICHVQQCKERRDLLAIQSAEQVAYEADRAEFAAAAQAAERDWQKAKHKEKQSKAKLVKSKDALLQDLHAIRESRAEGMDSTDPNACKLEMMNHAKQLRDGGYAKHPVLAIHLLRWHKKAPNEAWVLQVDPWMNLNMRGGMTNMEIQFIDLEDDEQKKADDTLTTLLAEHLMKHDTEIQMDCFAYECNDRFRELILEKMEEDDQTTLQDEFKKRVNSDVRTVKTLRSNKDQLDCFQVTDDFHLGENPDYMRHVIDAFNKKYRNDKIIVDDNEDGDESNDVWSDLPRLKRLVKKADELHTVQQDAMQVDEADKGTVAAPEPMDEVKPSDSDDNNTDDDLYGRGSEDDDGVEVTGKASHRSVKRLAEHSDDNARACKIMKVAERSGSVATSHDESADSSQSDLQQLHAQSNPRQLLYYNEQLMSTYFKKVDKIEVPVVGCGRCFYWAIQHALYWSSAEGRKLLLKSCKGTVMGMRKLMVEHANVPENSRADFTTQWKQKLLDPQNTTYATDLEIQTLATVMNIDIYVHDEGYIHEANALDSEGRDSSFYDSLKTTIIKADSASTEESKVSVHIMKKMNAHFNALVPAGKEEKAYRSNTYNWSNPEAANHVNGIDHMEWDLSPQHLSITHR